MSIVDDFLKGYDFIFMDKKSGLEDKLSNQNFPLEEFLKDDDAVKTILYMGANTQKYLNSEKIKKLIKLITEEPKEDDQLHGHKFPFVASEILKSQCPFIAKRFVLNEKEYHEEFPHSSEEEIDDLDFDFEEKNDNENNLKKKFEQLYSEFQENYKKIIKIKNYGKQDIKSKDDELNDESKNDNKDINNYEEECEEYEENKEDNAVDDIEKDVNNKENIDKNDEINKNINEKKDIENFINNNEETSDNNIKENLNEIENQNIENENNVENISNKDNVNEKNINNEETNEIMKEPESEEVKQEKNNTDEITDINKDNIEKQVNCDNNELKINEEKNNEINELNNDLKENKDEIIENNKDIIIEKNDEKEKKEEAKNEIIENNIEENNLEDKNNETKEKQNIIEENKEDNKNEISKSELVKNEEIKEENKDVIIKENNDEAKKEINNETKEEIKEETKKEIKEEIKEKIKAETKNENKNKEETKKENKDEVKEESKNLIKEETKNEIKEEIKNETKTEIKEEIKAETKNENEEEKEENKNEIKEVIQEKEQKETKEVQKEETKREIKDENKEDNKEDIKENNKEVIKDEIKKEIKLENKEEIKEENKEEIKDKNKDELSQDLKNEETDINTNLNNINSNKEELQIEDKKIEEEIKVKDEEKIKDIQQENINSELNQESNENNENHKLENEIVEENLKKEENEINDEKKVIQEQNIIEDDSEDKEEQEKKLENELKENDAEINLEEEPNEEINNIIIDKADEEKVNINNNKEENINNDLENIEDNQAFNIDNDNEDVKSLSVEGELDEDESNKKLKKKKVYKNSENNEYFDLLLNFVMTDKPELNYVLSGYFANVIISLVGTYPHKVLKYLYTQRRDALKNIVFHSNQKAMAILSSKLLNIESYVKVSSENNLNDFIVDNIPYRNDLIKEILTSINLDGFIPYSNQNKEIDIEGIFSLISGLIPECKILTKELLYNNLLCPHLFNILETNLYADIENKDNFNEDHFNRRYNIYGLFIDLTSKFLQNIQTEYSSFLPMDFDFQSLMKPKTDLQFNDNMIIAFGKILNNNFLAKKPPLILESMSSVKYEGLGSLNLSIFDLVKNMFYFMKGLPNQFDLLLIRNNFCERSIEYFFKYQWNNIYHNKFINFFTLYLEQEEKHPELTHFYFNHIKLQDLLLNFLQEIYPEKNIIITYKKNYEFKSGKKIKSGIYPHVIDLIYKIQAYSGLDVFTEEEKNQFGIKNLGVFEFSKDEKSQNIVKVLNVSNNLKNIFSKDEKWNSIFKSQILPALRKYEGKLCKKPKIVDDDDLEIRSDYSSLLQNMLNVLKKNPSKHYVLPISRNDKSWNSNVLNKGTNEKISIRSKLLNKGYRSRHIFDDDDDDDEQKDKDHNSDEKEKKEEEINENKEENEKDKMFYDSNYWEMKNDLPEKIKKEVDKKTNIIFNYNPITGENEKKSEISEEDELLSIAMGLEQNEKLEKNKKVMYIMPGRIKPINLKTKSNPVQNIFININKSNNNYKNTNLRKKKKDIINFFDTDNNENENEEQEKEEENAIENKDDKDEKIPYDETTPQENIDFDDNKDKNDKKENENDEEKFNDVNYWKSNDNYLNEEEMEELINDL